MRFFLLGAVYWIIVAAILAAVIQHWPDLARSQEFFYIAVLVALLGAFVVPFCVTYWATYRKNQPPSRDDILQARRE